ncbi:MAG TPA: response regulator [Brevibacillus sp.]|nr:response regulator [Brevibacillus sp.]
MKVLLVDDEPFELLNLQVLLEKSSSDYGITSAHHGGEALKILESEPMDLIFLDIRMPVLDGIAVLEQVKTSWPDTEIVMVSAYDEFSYAKQALELGASAYLLKPFSTNEFYDTLQKVERKYHEKTKAKPLLQQSLLEKTIRSGDVIDEHVWGQQFGFVPNVVAAVHAASPDWRSLLLEEVKSSQIVIAPESIGDAELVLSTNQHIQPLCEALLRCKLLLPDQSFWFGLGESLNLRTAWEEAMRQLQDAKDSITSRCLQFIQEHYQEALTLADVAKAVHVSPTHLNRLLKKETGCTFIEVLTAIRIERAKELLKKTVSIEYIAMVTGFKSAAYFSSTFKKVTGLSPRSFRRG